MATDFSHRAFRRGVAPLVFLAAALGCPALALGQESAATSEAADAATAEGWSVRAAVTGYFLKEQTYFVPVVAADHAGVHLEARYNYEGQRAGSVWLGWTVELGEALKLSLTPMFGAVFGEVKGLAPGVEWSLTWKRLTLYSELELVVDLDDPDGTYFYVWSELDGRVLEWLRVGMALQRTRAQDLPHLVQWGPLVGVSVWKLAVSAYWFNPGQSDDQYWVVTVGINL